jgi:NDP-sugar pyrophosphorylase family protein
MFMRAVILAGGKGRRLAPYTTILPKPLMPIGDVPILEIVIRQLKRGGFDRITMAVGYLAGLLMAYFNTGERYGVQIDYSQEREPLGTAGPLSLITDLDETFLLMNGDVLTNLDYKDLVAHHKAHGCIATIAAHRRDVKIDLGVLQMDGDGALSEYVEKPSIDYLASMGIYVFEPEILDYIPAGKYLDLPSLMQNLVQEGRPIQCYPFSGYWLDIGRHDDYERAVEKFEENPAEFLAEE